MDISSDSVMRLSLSHLIYPWMGMGGDLHKSFDKFPTPGNRFMLQTPCISYRDFKNNENFWTNAPTLGINYAENQYKSPPIA